MKIVRLRQRLDKRGKLVENTVEDVMSKSNHFFIVNTIPGSVRGNHFHNYKKEYFLVIKGRCLIVLEDIKTKIQEKIILTEKSNKLVYMEPKIAHAIKNIGKSNAILLALVNEKLDRNNPDTYKYEVIKQKGK